MPTPTPAPTNTRSQTIDARRCTLVLVDYQQRLMPAIDDGAAVVARALQLGRIARVLDIPVLGTEQNPRGLGPNVDELRALCDRTLPKMHFDACEDGLVDALRTTRDPSPVQVVVAGCEAHVCLLQTALGLLRAGLRVWVATDACGSRAATHHALAMQRLQAAGATLVCVEMAAFEWLHGCEHPRFKAVLPLLK